MSRIALLTLICCIAISACGNEVQKRRGIQGASCLTTDDCEPPLQCIKNVCVSPEKEKPFDVIDVTDIKEEVVDIQSDHNDAIDDSSDKTEQTGTDIKVDETGSVECESDEDCPSEKPRCFVLDGICVECLTNDDCIVGFGCSSQHECKPQICAPGSKECEGNNVKVCSENGLTYDQLIPCGDKVCYEGECVECIPGEKKCDGNSVLECKEDGSGFEVVKECEGGVGCVNGQCLECYPGDKECKDGDVYVCKQDGSGWELEEECEGSCQAGMCISPCGGDPKHSNVGCDYWAVDLDNAYEVGPLGEVWDAENQQFAVVVSNTSDSNTAHVVVSNAQGSIAEADVPPGGLHVFNLPPANIAGSLKAKLAYRIQSSLPIVAYQFNPLANYNVFSNDASLLLPTHALGSEYYVVSHIQDDPNYRGFVTVVAVEEGETHVTVTPTANVAPGNGVAGVTAGTPIEVTLEQYEVLNIETAGIGEDLTGTHVVADKKIAVFGGSECGSVPVANQCENGVCVNWPAWNCNSMADCVAICCCDHLEQQMTPVSAWGKKYAVAHSKFRGNESDTWLVMAAYDDTHITTTPSQGDFPVLNAGEFYSFESRDDFVLEADKPVLLVQFLASEQAPNPKPDQCVSLMGSMSYCSVSFYPCQTDKDCPPVGEPGDAGTGDPAMILVPPVEQFRDDYLFLVPQYYDWGNFLSIVAPKDAVVTLDNVLVAPGQFQPIADTEFAAARVPVSEGVHKIEADKPLSVIVHGFDTYVSYGYSAGMNVEVLNQ